MLANLVGPVVRCFPRVARVRPRVRHVATAPAVRRVVRHVARRAPRVAMICTAGALPTAALLLPAPPAPAPAPAAIVAPAPLPWGIGAYPLLPALTFGGGGGGSAGEGAGASLPGRIEVAHLGVPDALPPGDGGTFPGPDNPTSTPGTPPTQVPEPGFLFVTGLLAFAAVLFARRRARAKR